MPPKVAGGPIPGLCGSASAGGFGKGSQRSSLTILRALRSTGPLRVFATIFEYNDGPDLRSMTNLAPSQEHFVTPLDSIFEHLHEARRLQPNCSTQDWYAMQVFMGIASMKRHRTQFFRAVSTLTVSRETLWSR